MISLSDTHGNSELVASINKALNQIQLPFTPGRLFFVVPTADPMNLEFLAKNQGKYADGSDVVQTSLQAALDLAVTNRNDVILLAGNGTHTLTSMLDVSKSRVTIIGMDEGRQYGQKAKVSLAVSTGATNVFTMKNTGVRNTFKNIKFMNGNTVAQGIYCVGEGGEYALYENCEIYKSTDLDETTAAELVCNGDSAQFKNCTIGSLADAIAGSSIIRPNVQFKKGVVGAGLVSRDVMFENCLFWKQAADTTNVFMNVDADADIERLVLLKGCGFINSNAAANSPAVCIRLGATLTVGHIVLDPTCYASNVTKIATGTGVIVTGAAPNSGSGIGTNAA